MTSRHDITREPHVTEVFPLFFSKMNLLYECLLYEQQNLQNGLKSYRPTFEELYPLIFTLQQFQLLPDLAR